MLHLFLSANRNDLVARCRSKVARRPAPNSDGDELEHGIGFFLDQLIKTLQVEQTVAPMLSRMVSGDEGGVNSQLSEMGKVAARHGRELLRNGFTIEQVVHDYGDLCQAITDMASELDEPIGNDEFRTLNRCLDNAIAGAVTEFARQRDSDFTERTDNEVNERLGFFAHEARNLIHAASLSLKAVRSGAFGLSGATGSVVERSLTGLERLINRTLSEIRVMSGLPTQHELIQLDELIGEIKLSASLDAEARNCNFNVLNIDPRLAVDVDRDLLLSAAGNVLQNAFKFTLPGTEVTLDAHAVGERILIDVEDRCGGLPAGDAENMFLPFTQNGADTTGLGLGLSISRRSVEANHGFLTVRDIPGTGCIFTIDLPRYLVQDDPSKSEERFAASKKAVGN